jgi:hypothetical protein
MKPPKDPVITFPIGLVLGLAVGLTSGIYLRDDSVMAIVLGGMAIIALLILAHFLGMYPPPKPQRKRKRKTPSKPRTKKETEE